MQKIEEEQIGKLFSGEYFEKSTGSIRRFGGVLVCLKDNSATFKGLYKTFILNTNTIQNMTYRDLTEEERKKGGNDE